MPVETLPFDPAAYLDTDAAMLVYLNEALAGGDPAFIADALATLARARGLTGTVEQAGLPHEGVSRELGRSGDRELGTVLRVLQVLGLHLVAARGPGRPA